MEDIPLPKIGSEAVRQELGIDVEPRQRWESDEARLKAEEQVRKCAPNYFLAVFSFSFFVTRC